MSATDKSLRLTGYAEGWYALAFSRELAPGAVRACTFMGQELVVYQSASGIVRVEVADLTFGMRLRFVVMPTPIDDEHVDVHVVTQVARPDLPAGRLMAEALARVAAVEMGRDFSRDRTIWENKRYRARPGLAEGDGPILAYRRWADQFLVSAERAPGLRAVVG